MLRGISSTRRPQGVMRYVARAPLWLYHHDVGFLLGKRFLYLAHQGRLSGLRRETMLEVVRLDRNAGEVVVVAAWGNRADWVKNLRVRRALEIRLGHLRLPEPAHRFLPEAEFRALLASYRREHPIAWRAFTAIIGLPRDPESDDLGSLRAVAFRPAGGATRNR